MHCRQLAEHLSRFYDVEIYTNCAIDYMAWKNDYLEGTCEINGITVRRFRSKMRDPEQFALISKIVFDRPVHSDLEEELWLDEQGPVCSELLDTLFREQKRFKAVIFMTYLYYLTARGIQMPFENAYMIPTLHDEPPVYLRVYDKVFHAAKGFIWNTRAEKYFAEQRFPFIRGKPGVIAGLGIEEPENELPDIPAELKTAPYLLYAGRIEESKGCVEMLDVFSRYKRLRSGSLKLVLIGKSAIELPESDDIVYLGFVSDEMKFSLMREALALVLFSKYESLSLVVLESMLMGRPVLVNGKCQVLKEHCIQSNAGFYFMNEREFDAELDYLQLHEREYRIMCENGKRYVRENYRWEDVMNRIMNLIEG